MILFVSIQLLNFTFWPMYFKWQQPNSAALQGLRENSGHPQQ